jgi:hypothetical protein
MKPPSLFTVPVAAASIVAACGDHTKPHTTEEPLAEDEEFAAVLLSHHETTIAARAELVKAAAGGDRAAMAALESDDPVAEVDRRVRGYGMTVCGGER